LWSLLLLSSVLLIALIIAAPLASASGHGFLSAALYQSFSYVCHQQSERSFFVAGHPLAVCARCTGLYLGFAVATVLYTFLMPARRVVAPQRKWLFIALAPMAIDFGLGFLGIWDNTHSSRFLTGAIFGGVVTLYVMPALAEFSQSWRRRPNQTASAVWAGK